VFIFLAETLRYTRLKYITWQQRAENVAFLRLPAFMGREQKTSMISKYIADFLKIYS